MLHRIKKFFLKKNTEEVKKIVHIIGEFEPGYITVDIGKFFVTGENVPHPSQRVVAKIPMPLRQTINRVLAGVENDEDYKVFELFILSHQDAKQY